MNPSEFSIGVSAVTEGHFGGGQSHFADRTRVSEKQQGRSQHQSEDAQSQNETEDSPTRPSAAKEEEFEPTYDLSKHGDHAAHVGRILDVKL